MEAGLWLLKNPFILFDFQKKVWEIVELSQRHSMKIRIDTRGAEMETESH